jgi:hypothetical protein
MMQLFFDGRRDAGAKAALDRLTQKYGEPDVGTTRACFISKRCVIKFPINDRGERANDWEGSVSADHLARGRYITIDGFVCVIQEKLNVDIWNGKTYKDFPEWVGSIDCGQVGYDSKGNLKAFDFG